MTKGDMQMEDIPHGDKRASDLARRFVIEDLALKYRTTRQIAEKLLINDGRVAPSSPTSRNHLNERAAWSKAMQRQHERVNPEEDEVMDTDDQRHEFSHDENDPGQTSISAPLTEKNAYNPRRSSPYHDHPVVPVFSQAPTSRPTNSFKTMRPLLDVYRKKHMRLQRPPFGFRPFVWPYYYHTAGYPPYISPMRMFPHYPLLYSSVRAQHQTVSSHVRQSPDRAQDHTREEARSVDSPRNHLRPSQFGEKRRLVLSPQAEAIFSARRVENEVEMPESNIQKTCQETEDEQGVSTYHRPSVLVMKPQSPTSRTSPATETNRLSPHTSNDHRNCEHFTYDDDHETTDSDSSVSPPCSPRSRDSATPSDETSSTDSRRITHLNEGKPHKCHICGRAFRKHSALIIHHRVHSGEKPYRCSECSKQFSISGNLRRHLLIHTGERPYVCPECSRAFNNPSHLTRHRRKLHNQEPTGHK